MSHLRYLIVDQENIYKINKDDVLDKNLDKARWNNAHSKVLLKTRLKCPSWYLNNPVYNHVQILNVLNSPEWK
jgi:hypothetical protein